MVIVAFGEIKDSNVSYQYGNVGLVRAGYIG